MKKLRAKLKRSLICFLNAERKSARIPLLLIYAAFFAFGLFAADNSDEESNDIFATFVFFALIIDIIFTCIFYIIERSNYGVFDYHKYDNELIGDAFTGFSKKDRNFSTALDLLFARDLKNSLDLFISLKDYKLSDKEKAVTDFYIARCYQLMGYASNALTYYENAVAGGFESDLIPLFMARCHGTLGETERAIEIFNDSLEKENEYIGVMRTDIGRIYLLQNDGRNALKWFMEAVEKHEDYSNALGGCAIAYTLMHDLTSGEDYYKKALLNKIPNSQDFTSYYKEIQASVILDGTPIEDDQNN